MAANARSATCPGKAPLPPRIWLSEIMLQQTQVSTVIPYYAASSTVFPDIPRRWHRRPSTVLELWAGLGYYARARSLRRCAQTLVANHCGSFPKSAEEIVNCPESAVRLRPLPPLLLASARQFSMAYPKRVLTRCFGIDGIPGTAQTDRQLLSAGKSLLPRTDIEHYTQRADGSWCQLVRPK